MLTVKSFSFKAGEREVQPKRNEPGRPEVKFPAPNATDIPKEGLTDVPAQPKKRRPKRPSSAVAPNQDSAVIDPKILRRPPSARQSITMSVAQIALPDDNSGWCPGYLVGCFATQTNCSRYLLQFTG